MSGVMFLSENKAPEDMDLVEFNNILEYTVEEFLLRAWTEKWQVKHIEFWLKVKNAQNFETIALWLEEMKTQLVDIGDNINDRLADISEKT